ncbi:MAG TPA: hypothetical protein PLJ35_11060 [Anaerolineae bacterium]|nr:hypothetical protein [Anaerolineae bacterium]HOQ99347.1 hypothetical protein [Anaerolineae bacterium]HPL26784.1 hypothetical protein [Anaerolineae bacterium]
MSERVTVTTERPALLRPLLGAAIQNEAKLVAHGIKRTRDRLALFEKRFGISSEEFERRFDAGEIEETLDYIEWSMEIRALRLLQEQHQVLSEARVD